MKEAGFVGVTVASSLTTALGTLDFLVAEKAWDSSRFVE
jgi:hypothetical protein